MDPVACGQCGKQDDESNMFVCSGCFEFHFCSEAHFDAHPHSRIADAQHFTEADVGVNVLRTFKKGDYRNALERLADTYVSAIQAGSADALTDRQWMTSLEAFLRELSKKEQGAFIRSYTNFINQLKTTLFAEFEKARQSLLLSSKEITDIFARENRLSFRQRKRAIEAAWWRFIDALLLYHLSVDREIARNDINDMAVIVGRILGGGKDEYKAPK